VDVDALRAAVAKKHNVILGRDDPILLTVHLNELLLAEVLTNMRSIATESRNESIAAVSHQVEVAKRAAGTLITQTAGYVAGEIQRQVKATLNESTALLDQARRLNNRAKMWVTLGAALALILGGTAVGVLAAVFLKR